MGAAYRHPARATVALPVDVVLARLHPLLPGRVRPLDAASCVVDLAADTIEKVVEDLVALGADFALDAPDEVRAQVRAAGKRLLDAG